MHASVFLELESQTFVLHQHYYKDLTPSGVSSNTLELNSYKTLLIMVNRKKSKKNQKKIKIQCHYLKNSNITHLKCSVQQTKKHQKFQHKNCEKNTVIDINVNSSTCSAETTDIVLPPRQHLRGIGV